MKRKIYLMVLLTLSVIIINNGCTKEKEYDNCNLKNELIELNKKIYSKMDQNPEQKSWESIKNKISNAANQIGKACAVAGADLVSAGAGAMAVKEIAIAAGVATGGSGAAVVVSVGAAIAGVGGSYATGKEVYKSTPPSSGNSSISGAFVYDESGPIHNELLFEKYNDENIDMVQWYYNRRSIPTTIDTVFYLSEWNQFTNFVTNSALIYATSECDIDALIISYQNSGYITNNMVDVYNSFFEIFITIDDFTSLNILVNDYVNYVQNSTFLNEDEKNALLISFSVAEYSPYFWMQFSE
ncbi:MAG TPA: hypothetical protein PLF32_05825 [Bacteroidales bacterium]|nr:hypothetical protein [Bacteroidales bacterium]HOR82154.1 hypothetical protein [Bacteroidales bacterium]HPJ91446.1 hypothetical protein [Bacteroidales bacterium]